MSVLSTSLDPQNCLVLPPADASSFSTLVSAPQEARAAAKTARGEHWAIQISNVANIVLFIVKVAASIESGSLSIIASTLDSLLDLLSGFILWYTARSMRRHNPYKYPIGKARMQPLGIIVFASIMATLGFRILLEGFRRLKIPGIIVFASIMATLGFQVLLEGVRRLTDSSTVGLGSQWQVYVAIMLFVIAVKSALYFYCRIFTGNDIVMTYAQDHFFDVVTNTDHFFDVVTNTVGLAAVFEAHCLCFDSEVTSKAVTPPFHHNATTPLFPQDHFFDVVTNTVGLAAAVLAGAVAWWIDPVGAILVARYALALYTMINWGRTVLENVNSLTGRSAPPEFLQKITYLCWNHHEAILAIDTVRAYTFGTLYFTEVDVVLPRDMPLELGVMGEAYTFGTLYFTEVDVVLPRDMPLEETHDIGESLQNKLERLPEIERAFVHLDYEETHDIGESLQNKLERLPEIERAFVHLDYEVEHRPEHHQHSSFPAPPAAPTITTLPPPDTPTG
ncbi:unnamed protein product [Closterium sp. NIES-64]|nr:unnamed protein product [Closterium sp. NIES-64]